MTPDEFIRKWRASRLKERSGAQEHFGDLCRLVGHPTPADADPDGISFTFEKGAKKTGGGEGWADVWKRGCFALEYKGKHKDLNRAYAQLQRYAVALESPPLLVVSDMETIIIHTNFTNTVQETRVISLDDPRARAIADAARRLNELRENWLNPPELVRREPEVVPGYPDRLVPIDAGAAAELKKRTLTNLYNQRPTWLANAHRDLDSAVAAAYGWGADISDEDFLGGLLRLNRQRVAV